MLANVCSSVGAIFVAYNSITRISGTRAARRQLLRSAYLQLTPDQREKHSFAVAQLRLQTEAKKFGFTVEVDLAATDPNLPLSTRIAMARRAARVRQADWEEECRRSEEALGREREAAAALRDALLKLGSQAQGTGQIVRFAVPFNMRSLRKSLVPMRLLKEGNFWRSSQGRLE